WSLGLNPAPDEKNYNVIYGFGYTKYIDIIQKIIQELEVYVPKHDACKVNILTLKNTEPNKKKLQLDYYIRPVLGDDEINQETYINMYFNIEKNIVIAKNLFNMDFIDQIIYISSNEKIKSFTGDKKSFIGNGSLSHPKGVIEENLNNSNGL